MGIKVKGDEAWINARVGQQIRQALADQHGELLEEHMKPKRLPRHGGRYNHPSMIKPIHVVIVVLALVAAGRLFITLMFFGTF